MKQHFETSKVTYVSSVVLLLVLVGLNGSNHNNGVANAEVRRIITSEDASLSTTTTRRAVLPSRQLTTTTTTTIDDGDEGTLSYLLMETNIALIHNNDNDNDDLKYVRPSTNNRKNHHNNSNKNIRRLSDGAGNGLLTTRTFPECIEQKLSPKECQNYIEQQIEDAGGHEVGDDIQVKIRTPRTEEQFAETYWMVEVPVNAYGIVACDRNKGFTHYPFQWKDDITGEELNVEDQNCYGLTGTECCFLLRNYGKQLTESGYDINKQCLSCFVHREPLEPIKNRTNGNVEFLEYQSNPTIVDSGEGYCIQEQLTGDELDVLDDETELSVRWASSLLNGFKTARNCDLFEELLGKLYVAASVIFPLNQLVGQFACIICYGKHDLPFYNFQVNNLIDEMLDLIKSHLRNHNKVYSKEKCIIIHTNLEGTEVVQDPTFGNGRTTDLPIPPTSSPSASPMKIITTAPVPTPPTTSASPTEDFGPCYYPCNDDEYCGIPFGEKDRYECITKSCREDPSICSETEFCSNPRFYYEDFPDDWYFDCYPNPCLTNPLPNCEGGTQRCVPLNPYETTWYICIGADCENDPSVCADDEFCAPFPHQLSGIQIKYQCRPISCQQDPTMCSDTEWCYVYEEELDQDFTSCLENLCITTSPCDDETEICIPTATYYSNNSYLCKERTCEIDPTVCDVTTEYCDLKYDRRGNPITSYCVPYKEVGDNCSKNYECNPEVAFCRDSTFYCKYKRKILNQFEGTCVAYGEGLCAKERTGEVTQENCKSNEFCSDVFEHCQPNFGLDECCDGTLNSCARGGEEKGTQHLVCAPNIAYETGYFAENLHYTCRPSCETDEDCDGNNNEWCAPLDESDPDHGGKFCKEYKNIGELCDVVTTTPDGIINGIHHTEERCDPSIAYCHDPFFCLERDTYYDYRSYYSYYYEFFSSCQPYGNPCSNNGNIECNDPISEWCDTSVGFCKKGYERGECCTGDEGSNEECKGSETTCRLYTQDDSSLVFWDISKAFPGLFICA